jgi:hypothetical protein
MKDKIKAQDGIHCLKIKYLNGLKNLLIPLLIQLLMFPYFPLLVLLHKVGNGVRIVFFRMDLAHRLLIAGLLLLHTPPNILLEPFLYQ